MFVFKKSKKNNALYSILEHQTCKAYTLTTAQQQNKETQKLSKLEVQKQVLHFSTIKKLHKKVLSFKP